MAQTRKDTLRAARLVRVKRHGVFVGVIMALLLVAFLLVVYIAHLPVYQLKKVSVVGGTLSDAVYVEEQVTSRLAESRFLFFPRSNRYLSDFDQIERDLLVAVPRLREVSIDESPRGTLRARVTQREPNFLWTRAGADVSDYYYVDSGGYIYAKAPAFSGNVFFVFRGGLPGANPIGRYVLPKERLAWLSILRGDLSQMGIDVIEMWAGEISDYTLQTKEGWLIHLDGSQDTSVTLNALARALDIAVYNREQDSDDIKYTTKDLEYVDVRFGSKAFFRFRDFRDSD